MPRRALVTGGAVRLGRAMALALGRAGYDVALHCGSSRDAAAAVAAELGRCDVRSTVVQADLADEAAVATLVSRASSALGGPLTLLVNNAAVFDRDDMAGATRDGWDRHMAVNLRAPFVLMQGFAAQAPDPLREGGEVLARAAVVNMLDQQVSRPSADFITYTLSKSALWSLTRSAALALAPGIRVNGIAPGHTMPAARQSAAHFRATRATSPLQRGPDPDDIVDALLYLASARAVTGLVMHVDGGQGLGAA